MHPPVGAARWTALREIREGEPPTFPRLAVAAGLHPATIRERACMENWIKQAFQSRKAREAWAGRGAAAAPPTGTPMAGTLSVGTGSDETAPAAWQDMPPAQRLAWLNDVVTRQVAQIAAASEAAGGALDKARMDAVWSMIRMVEKSETLAQERADNNETGTDAELADRLRKLDDRIVELARAHAEWLVAGGDRSELG